MRLEEKILVSSTFSLIFFFLMFFISGSPLFLFGSSAMLPGILIYIFKMKNYSNKIVYPTLLAMLVLQGSILIYIYLFDTEDPLFFPFFYLAVGIFMVYIISFVYYYPRRKKYEKYPGNSRTKNK